MFKNKADPRPPYNVTLTLTLTPLYFVISRALALLFSWLVADFACHHVIGLLSCLKLLQVDIWHI